MKASEINGSCPCKKKSCPRHGDCRACREHHAASKRQRPVQCEKRAEKNRKRTVLIAVIVILLLSVIIWTALRRTAAVSCTKCPCPGTENYTEPQKVLSAISLSYLVYGCETCDAPRGTVSEILDTERMGIIIENADISRADPSDPSTARIDTAGFIRQTAGKYRLIKDLKDGKSGFYGAAFADDENKTVWLCCSGSVSFTDAIQSLLLVIGPRLSGQEKRAFELYEDVLKTDEIQNGYSLILTGHSLGGALASMVSRLSGAEAVTISGADGFAVRKIDGITGGSDISSWISNYLTSPEGFEFSFKDSIQRMMFLGGSEDVIMHTFESNGMTENSHSPFGFVRYENGKLQPPPFTEETQY